MDLVASVLGPRHVPISAHVLMSRDIFGSSMPDLRAGVWCHVMPAPPTLLHGHFVAEKAGRRQRMVHITLALVFGNWPGDPVKPDVIGPPWMDLDLPGHVHIYTHIRAYIYVHIHIHTHTLESKLSSGVPG